MPDLRVPPEHQRALGKLASLSDRLAGALFSKIEQAARREDTERLSASALGEIPGLSSIDVEEIVDTVLSLYRVRVTADVPVNEFVSDICGFLQSPESKEFRLPENEVELTSNRLVRFLSIAELSRAVKAEVLRYEHERTLCNLRVLTDARPIFGNDASTPPDAAVVFHMLKIAYHESNQVREMYFSLDENDLEELKKAVQRAEAKAISLRAALAAAHIAVIRPA